MSLPVSLFCVLLECTGTFLLLKSFQGKSLNPNKSDVAYLLIQLIWAPIPDSYGVFALFLGQIINFVYFFIQADRKLIPTTFLLSTITIFSDSTQGLSSLLLFPVMKVLPIEYLPPLGSTIAVAMIVLLVCLAPLSKLFQIILNGNTPLKFLVLNTYLGAIIITLFYKTHMEDVYEYTVLIFFTLFLMLFVNVCIFYYENQLKKQQHALLTYEKNKPIFETLIEDIRSNQHEYDNRIQSLASLADICHDYETLRIALLKYTAIYHTRQKCYPLLNLNMPLIASTLYRLTTMAEEKELTMLYDIPNPVLNCKISEHIIVDFLHILTQNAIEASQPGEYIYITLLNQNDAFYFEVQNPVDHFISADEIGLFFQKGYSTKTEQSHPKPEMATPHGYGLSQLLSKVNKLGGAVSADCVYNENKNWMIFSLTL